MSTTLPISIGRPATNALNSAGITCLEDLSNVTEKELSKMHGVGPKAIRILKEALQQHNVSLQS